MTLTKRLAVLFVAFTFIFTSFFANGFWNGAAFTANAQTLLYKKLAAGYSHTLAIQADGSLWAWGSNSSAQLGTRSRDDLDHTTPTRIIPSGMVAVAAGDRHSLALHSDGSLWSWGNNTFGQLGTGLPDDVGPLMVIDKDVIAIAASSTSSYALKSDGSLWGWGNNSAGQLGDSTTNTALRPKMIIDADVIAIAAGGSSVYAIKSDGSLWAWGANSNGQLGTGDKFSCHLPTLIIPSGVTDVAAGSMHTLALKSDGTLWAWGTNNFGQIGDGTVKDVLTPKQIMLSGVRSIQAGVGHSIALKTDGSVWTWGLNQDGQLGGGTTTNSNIPKKVIASGVIGIEAGYFHTLALKTDGSLWTCGYNMCGQLGYMNSNSYYLFQKALSLFDQYGFLDVENDMLYNTDRTIVLKSSVTATLNGISITSETVVNQDGNYVLILTDGEGNSKTINFQIDKTPPVVTGVENGMSYSTDVTAYFDDGEAKLNGASYLAGTTIHGDGDYSLVITDIAGNVTSISFSIDTTPPVVTGVENSAYYNTSRTITFNEGTATLNGVPFSSGTIVSAEKAYTLVVTNATQIKVTIAFIIDKTPPVVNVTNNYIYTINKTINFNEGTATLNDQPFSNNSTVSVDGSYVLVITDRAGNHTTVSFTVDKPLTVSGISNNGSYNKDVTILLSEGTALLNGSEFASGDTVSLEGNYLLVCSDTKGAVTTFNFTIDKTAPMITIAPYNNDATNQDVVVKASTNEGALNQTSYTFTANGSFEFVATDLAGNISKFTVTISNIDKAAPIVTGVTNGKTYPGARTVTFCDGTATLNGANFLNGSSIIADGAYSLIVTDAVGNFITINFSIANSGYKIIENLIMGISPETTALNFKNGVNIDDGQTIKVRNNDNLELTDSILVGTGMKVQIFTDNSISAEHTIIIFGDVSGNGNINALDLLALKKHLLRTQLLADFYLAAANCDRDINSTITAIDLLKLKRHLLNIDKISQN